MFTIVWKSPWVTIFPYQPFYLIFIWRVEEKSLDILDVVESFSPYIFPRRPWQSIYLTKWIIWMNLSLLKFYLRLAKEKCLYVKALMSSRSYSYEKIGNYLDRVRERELQWLLTLKKNGPCFSGRATSKKGLDARHFCNRVQIQSPGLSSFCHLWLDNSLGWVAECMENRKDASQKQPQGETCNDACETFLFPFPLRMHPVLTRGSVTIDVHLWDLEVLF